MGSKRRFRSVRIQRWERRGDSLSSETVIGAVRRTIREILAAARGSGGVGVAAARDEDRSVGGRSWKAGSASVFEGRWGNTELFLERGCEVARVRIAQVGSHHGHRGVALTQATTRFVHALPLE